MIIASLLLLLSAATAAAAAAVVVVVDCTRFAVSPVLRPPPTRRAKSPAEGEGGRALVLPLALDRSRKAPICRKNRRRKD